MSIAGKLQAIRTLSVQFRHFQNWREVFGNYRNKTPLPPLILRGGMTLYHGPEDDAWSLFDEIFLQRCYTAKGFYQPKAGDTVIDCGANIGFFALYLRKMSRGARIFCFEPSAATRSRLERNVSENRLGTAIQVLPYAIFDANREVQLKIGAFAGDSSLVRGADPSAGPFAASTEKVKCLSLSEAIDRCGGGPVQLLKIDVEGAELEILEGARSADFDRIERIALECHEAYRPGTRDRLLALLEEHYSGVRYQPFRTEGELGVIQAWGRKREPR